MYRLLEEKKIFDQGFGLIAGLDEAGRGPLAGPVVAACVLLKKGQNILSEKLQGVNDSKLLTEKQREELFELINHEFIVGIGICDNKTIDDINILEATFLAMKKALGSLKNKPDFLMVDGRLPLKNTSISQNYYVGGDAKIFLIAAASIIAKVTRDRLMKDLARQYPAYGFDQHKGYGTKLHMEMIKKLGPSPIHRYSFEPIKSLE